MEEDRSKIEKKINIVFKNKDTLRNVFVHRSYLNENRESTLSSNEKLEFLGDSVLSLVTSIYLYKTYDSLEEGDYTDIKASIVRTESLAEVATELSLGSYLFLSNGEEKSKGRQKTNLLADVFEALVAAIYLDHGFDKAYDFIVKFLFLKRLDKIIKNKLYLSPKSRLQEYTQLKFKQLPEYELISSKGPEHNKEFYVRVLVQKKLVGTGFGKSKKQAEELAAGDAMKALTGQ